jgi:predicted negative regulator of RcsB-dependent stress response
MKKGLSLLLLGWSWAACTSAPVSQLSSVFQGTGAQIPEVILSSEKNIDREDYASAEISLAQFQQDFPHSVFAKRVRLDSARTQMGLGNYHEALQILQDLLQENIGKDKEAVALCTFYSAEAYLHLGEETKAMAALLDAEGMSESLPPEIAAAELPAKLGVSYRAEENWEKAREYFRRAQSGAERVYSDTTPQQSSKKAFLYFTMGQFSAQSAAGEPVKNLEVLEGLQIFSLRAMEIQDAVWSQRAQKDLMQSYINIWNLIMAKPENRAQNLSVYTTNLEKLKTLAPVTPSPQEKELFAAIETLEAKADMLLKEEPPQPALTPEAIRRDRLRRTGTVYADPFFYSEKKSNSQLPKKKQVLKPDPNLESH